MTDRGLSTTVSYVLTLSITALLIIGLILATSGAVESQRQTVTREELRVIGQQIASRLLAADRLAATGAETVRIEYTAPSDVAGSDYRIEVRDGDPATLYLNATDLDTSVSIPVSADADVVETSVRGGGIEIVLTDPGELEVRAA